MISYFAGISENLTFLLLLNKQYKIQLENPATMRGYNPLLPASRGVYTYCNKMLVSKVLDYNMF